MFRSSMRSSSGSSLFSSLSMLLILKIIKIFKKYYHPTWLCGSICLVCLWCLLCGGVSWTECCLYEKVHELVWMKLNQFFGPSDRQEIYNVQFVATFLQAFLCLTMEIELANRTRKRKRAFPCFVIFLFPTLRSRWRIMWRVLKIAKSDY